MCLDYITKDVSPVKEGYKIYIKTLKDGVLKEEVQNGFREIGKWYCAQPRWRRILHMTKTVDTHYHSHILGNDESYEAGFHIIHSLEEARLYRPYCNGGVIVKVQVEDPICTGTQSYLHITVARKIRIVEIVE